MSQDQHESRTTETPIKPPQTKEELISKLQKLQATATQQYALKNYSEAAEAFSEAVEVQDAINGEMAVENADLLYLYGRCLYHVGVSNSDVLGSKVAQQEEPKHKRRKIAQDNVREGDGGATESLPDQDAQPKEQASAADTNGSSASSKPFFQITGDENWTDSEEEDDPAEHEGPMEEEEEEEGGEDDDLAIAYEILDSARVLFIRRVESEEAEATDNSGEAKPGVELRSVKERLADTYDLQAEIKLENEQFEDAVSDAQQALAYKLQLYPQESGMVAEAHYKLSIALDFAALPMHSAETGESEGKVDEDMRKRAAEEMEKAIMSCQARMEKGEASLAGLEGAKLESVKRDVADARDLVQDMKTRLVDLRTPLAGAASTVDALNGVASVKGLLGELLGHSKSEQVKMLNQATANANDLSGLVKHRKKPRVVSQSDDDSIAESHDKAKRKLDALVDEDSNEHGKKVKFESAS